jgi:hypothetical protein
MKNSTQSQISYLENLLKSKGCPTSEVTPFAMQILNDCKKSNKSVYDVELG